MMRQAGRHLPEYREILATRTFLEVCSTPELAAEVTLQPVRRYRVDAAILFADILLILDAMGAGLTFAKGVGPRIARPVRRRQDLENLQQPDVEATLGYVFDALREVARGLKTEGLHDTTLVGFAGTPWTVAAYLVEGGTSKYHDNLLGWSYRDPAGLRELLDRLADVTIEYLLGQIDAGAQALQLFDSWGALLDEERWQQVARPSVERILDALGDKVPTLFYIRHGAHLLNTLKQLPVNALSVDWRQPLSAVRKVVGDKPLQGNLDPGALLSTPEEVRSRVKTLLQEGQGGAHIVNLGHGVLPMTPVENASAFVRAVAELGQPFPGDD